MTGRIFKKIAVIGITACLCTTSVFAAQSSWHEKLGIEEVHYPEINDKIGANSYFTRLGYGMSEGTGAGINLLVFDYEGELHESVNNTKSLYKYIIPSAKVTYIETDGSSYKDLSKFITEELDKGNDIIKENNIICISKFNYTNSYLYDLVADNQDKYFIISGENPNLKDPLFTTYLEDLNVLDNTLIVAGSCSEGIDKELISQDILGVIDVFVQTAPTSKEKANDYRYHNTYSESGRMDNALGLAASSLAILLENGIKVGDVGAYYKENSKRHALSLGYNKYSFEPKTDYDIPVLDYKVLFKKSDSDDFVVKGYNLLPKYNGEGVKIALVDAGSSTSSTAQNYIKHAVSFPKDYKAAANKDEIEGFNIDILKAIVPNAEVTLLSAKSDLVKGDYDTTYIKNALDWVLKNGDKIDILSINAPIEVQKDKELLKKITAIADKGVIASWIWMPAVYNTTPNILTPNSYQGKIADGRYLSSEDELKVYDRFFGNFDMNKDFKWGNSAIASTAAALEAILKQADSTITGREIKLLYKNMLIERDDSKDLGLPNMKRITSILENHLTYRDDFSIAGSDININFDTPTDVKINGIFYRGITTTTIPFSSVLSVAIDKNGERIAEGSQLVDLDVLRADDGTTFIDSTFNGKVITDMGEIQIVKGLNKMQSIHPNAARNITICYNVK